MCGIAGYWRENWRGGFLEVVRAMGDAIRHRGPDDHGEWCDAQVGVALGHRRLSIIDLSREGHQPMISESGRYVIVFNGEVFNFQELRRELEDFLWRGHSDTEVMLAAFEKWGIQKAVERFVGMFAFAVWDRQQRELYLVRDRLGIKPLYYGHSGGTLLFASELKALRAHPDFSARINRGAVMLLMRHNYIPHPHCIYEGIYKLPPGTILRLSSDKELPMPEPYWSAADVSAKGNATPLRGSPEAAVDKLHQLLKEAVQLRMVSDVPIGAFLSGGIDSSTVVALMQEQSTYPVQTFSIGFAESTYDEAPYAAKIAKCLGTNHTELYVTPREAQEVVPSLPELYDEPFSDSSQVPTILVSRLARRHVTVSLSGDGGDELFAGYPRYAISEQLWKQLSYFPRWARTLAARGLELLSAETLEWLLRPVHTWLPERIHARRPIEQVERISRLLSAKSPDTLYHTLVSHWSSPETVVAADSEPLTAFTDASRQGKLNTFLDRMMLLDLVSYLPDDILTKVDRASMSVSLEARVPLLDHRVVELAWSLPAYLKQRNGQDKWILRQVLYKYIPSYLVDRPKMGFGVPIGSWIRGPLRDWAEELLASERIKADGILNPATVQNAWTDHVSGRRNREYQLWDVLMFQSWLQHSGSLSSVA
jgi:asparagine synthase (glutamine-hydrolysing)